MIKSTEANKKPMKRKQLDDGEGESKAKKLKQSSVAKSKSALADKSTSGTKMLKSKPSKQRQFISKDGKKGKKFVSKNASKESDKKSQSSDLKKKDRKKLRKQKESVNFQLAADLKSLWEELRNRAELKADKRQDCCSKLFKMIHGQARTFIFAHDTCRVFQTFMKYANEEQKSALFDELKMDITDIMKSKYAKFFVKKLMKYGTKAQREYIFHTMQANLRGLVKHKECLPVIEYAYNNFANASHRMALASAFYGPAFTVFKTAEDKTLQLFLKAHPERQNEVMNFMKQSLSLIVDKSILQHSFVHRLFDDFMTNANDKQRSEMIETLRDNLVHMLHTHDGAHVSMLCIWHGTAKDRKAIIKSFKTFVVKICKEEFGHMVLLALFDAVDDTKIIQKAIISEMLASLDDLVGNRYGRKVLLYLLNARDPVYFHPDVVATLKQGDNNAHSKKDSKIRQAELLSFVSAPFVKHVAENCEQLLMQTDTQPIVLSTIKHCTTDVTSAMKAVAEVAAKPFQPAAQSTDKTSDLSNSCQHIVDHQNGHYLLKRLIGNDADRIAAQQTALFSDILIETVPAHQFQEWTTSNRGCFVLISLLELNNPSVSNRIRQYIEAVKSSLKKHQFKGAQILLTKLT